MKLIKRAIERDGSGSVTLYPEEPEDMWHAYNLILPGDILNASAIRRVTTESAATGSTSSQRVHTYLSIRVRSLDFDPQAGQLHVSGQIATENRYTKIGQYHTLDLELLRNFTLIKEPTQNTSGWDSIALKQLDEATNSGKSAEAIAIIMQEGLANIAIITPTQTILKQRIETSIPRKRANRTGDHDRGLEKFFSTVLDTLLRLLDSLSETTPSTAENTTRPILLASPGFTATSFLKYIDAQLSTSSSSFSSSKQLQSIRRTVLPPIHSSTGHLHSLTEILSSTTTQSQLSSTKYLADSVLMNKFLELLRKDDGRAWYGPREVESAVEKGAVGRGGGVLIISGRLFRSQDVRERKRWVGLCERVREQEGGEVRVLSESHESGRRLEDLGGIAAILTWPIEDMEEEDENGEGNTGKA